MSTEPPPEHSDTALSSAPIPDSSTAPITIPADHSTQKPENDFKPGDRVQLAIAPPYFKTADPMPMLRPPDLIAIGDLGILIEPRPSQTWAVKFRQGVILLDERYLALA